MEYPLYDVPYLVREPNDRYMSKKRHDIEVYNQSIVDDYFIERDNGAPAREARQLTAAMHGITTERFRNILIWFYREAQKRKKYDFLEKFPLFAEHKSRF